LYLTCFECLLDGIDALIREAHDLQICSYLDSLGGQAALDVFQQGFQDIRGNGVVFENFVGLTGERRRGG